MLGKIYIVIPYSYIVNFLWKVECEIRWHVSRSLFFLYYSS